MLFRSQAMAINEERKVATSEVRTSQDMILINGVSFSRSASFEIKAIIDPDKIDSYVVPYLLSVGDSLKKQIPDESLSITIRKDENVTIPALNEDRIAYQMDFLEPVE